MVRNLCDLGGEGGIEWQGWEREVHREERKTRADTFDNLIFLFLFIPKGGND